MSEKISVIIPAYNRASTIKKSVDSVINQTYDNLEIIIVDDCSNDNTAEIIGSIGDDRIIYHRLAENKGAGGARNAGVSLATSDIIAFHDSDDECMPDRIQKQYVYMIEHPEYDLVYSCYVTSEDDGTMKIFPHAGISGSFEGNIYRDLMIRNTVDCPTMMIKKDTFLSIGGFNESYRCIEDWEFIVRFAKDHLIGFINEPLISSLFISDGITNDNENFFRTRARMIAEEKCLLEEEGLFNEAVLGFFNNASSFGNLEFAKTQLMHELAERVNKG